MMFKDGDKISIEIGDDVVKGMLVIEDSHAYMVHNSKSPERHDGARPDYMRGYQYSWSLGREIDLNDPTSHNFHRDWSNIRHEVINSYDGSILKFQMI
jgi:hypothetical protein